jgi:hypothetical protein
MEKIVTESEGKILKVKKDNDKVILSISKSSYWSNNSAISMSKRQVLKLINELNEVIK